MITPSAERIRHDTRPRSTPKPNRRGVPVAYRCDCGRLATWIAPVVLRSATGHKIHTVIHLCDVCHLETQDRCEPAIVELAIGAQEWLDLFERAVDAGLPDELLALLCRGRLAASPAGRREQIGNGNGHTFGGKEV